MTVSVSNRQSINYSGPQSSGHEYEFSFRLHDASMLYVEITDGDGVKTEADPNDYSVTLNYDQYGNPGGIVTYDLALPYGSFLRVISRLEIQQQSELTATPSYVPRNVEDALDYLAMTMQDQGRAVEEAVNVAQYAAASAASASANAASAAADADAAASAAADSEAAAELLSVLQDGTPTNEAIAEGNTVLAALWKLQGQILAKQNIAVIDTYANIVANYPPNAARNGVSVWITDRPNSQGGAFVCRESTGTPGTYIYDRAGGGVIVEDTYSNIIANYAAATYSGCYFWATNGAGYALRSDGTNWIVQLYPNVTTTLSSSSGVVTVDCRAGYSRFSLALTENVTSWSFTNLPTTGRYCDFYVEVTQHASSAKTCVSPATSGRTAGGVWVQSPTLSSIETLGLRVFSDGSVNLFPSGVMA